MRLARADSEGPSAADRRRSGAARHFDLRLWQAARGLGATLWSAFRQVTLPLIRPGVLVRALFAFITPFDELIIALFFSGSGAITLPRRAWDDLRSDVDPTKAAVATLTILLTALLLSGAPVLRQRASAVR
jgi:putative spermidine/putrescine transport system permease protein